MTIFIMVPSERFPGATRVDAAWSLDEQPTAATLAAARLQQLRAAGIDAQIRTQGGALITPVAESRMVH